ncbi:hypothetical protein M9Y10_006291 [Tritrichomonas musculus]|uniref:Protein kinase domain-containing protein n=1 Tax=Tritrichomonas musculus TaxID=1915356 RepID=A0ABR2JEA7_9EUKA
MSASDSEKKISNLEGKKIGKFKLVKAIGEGAFSSVYLAEQRTHHHHKKSKDNASNDTAENKDNNKSSKEKENKPKEIKHYVACKIIPRTKIEAKKMTTRLDQEIKVHQLMHHPNVVQLIDVHKNDQYYFIFLEFCSEGELFDLVISKSKLTEDEAAIYFKQILIGLRYIHSLHVAHRDMKPENILLDQFGHVKISDFGLSKLLDEKSEGLTKTPCGSPCYASPECISGKPYDGRKNDVWSCGVILYAITTGLLPWTKRNQKELFKQIQRGEYSIPSYLSENCSNLISRLLTVDNTKRITIDEALEHPFLKDVVVPDSNLDPKFVSLRKVDRFLGIDKDFHIQKMISNIPDKQCGTDTKFQLSYTSLTRGIETDDEKKKDVEENRFLVRTTSRSNIDLGSIINSNEPDDQDKDKDNNSQHKLPKRPPLPPNIKARTDIKNNNAVFAAKNNMGVHILASRRSQGPSKIIY